VTSGWRLAGLRLYYWITPLFVVLDWVWGVSVRAAFLPRFEHRLAYYVLCLLCAVVCQREPGAAPYVGLGESSVNLFLLLLGIMLPIWQTSDAILAGAALPALMSPAKLVNAMLSGGMIIVSFHRSQLQVGPRGRPPSGMLS
jgi:hypothetical protein